MDIENSNISTPKKWNVQKIKVLDNIRNRFGVAEKVIFYFFSALLIISSLSIVYNLNNSFSVNVPADGGEITEGIIGSPRFINPVLALSDADRDLTSLIYSGLLKAMPDGSLVPDLAESYTISEDGLVYTFTLKPNLTFHDGTEITTNDIEFTIQKAQDAGLKSPKRSNWEGIRVEKIDDKIIRFILKQPYTPFIENATMGILPKHIWKNIDNESFLFSSFNTKPIGSGPYMTNGVITNESGLPVEYNLKPFKKYSLGKPFISKLNLKFYTSEKNLIEAYEKKEINSINSISPDKIWEIKRSDGDIIKSPLPRIFGLFLNQTDSPALGNSEVRKALNMATPKEEIIRDVLYGYGKAINGPTPDSDQIEKTDLEEARKIIEKAGFKINEDGIYEKNDKKEKIVLKFSISTSDTPELKAVAEILQEAYRKINIETEIKIFEIGDLNQNIIRPRKYEALLFGEIVGRDLDLYPFWHSSQRNDPGLNISLYTNIKADKILDEMRKSKNQDDLNKYLLEFEEELKKDNPAIFIYSPYFIYIVPKEIKNLEVGKIGMTGERFANIHKWFIETNNVWKIFNRQINN